MLAVSKAIGCDESYVALPLLTAIAASIGSTRKLSVKRSWLVPSILWTAIVGESGSQKSPAFNAALSPLHDWQRKKIDAHKTAMDDYEVALQWHEKKLTDWKRNSKTGKTDPPKKPEPPTIERQLVSDTTVEALAKLFLENPRGLLLARDELAGWFGSFDRYASGKGGADSAHYLSMYNGKDITVDRKSGFPPTIYVPAAPLSITGGIQPAILRKSLGKEHRESGLAARFLLAMPPRKAKRWTDSEVDPGAEQVISTLIGRLHALEPEITPEGWRRPKLVHFTDRAKEEFEQFYNSHAEETASLGEDLSGAWSKLEETVARFVLIFFLVRVASKDRTLKHYDKADETDVRNAITLGEWFKNETRRVYRMLEEGEAGQDRRRFADWIDRKGGMVTARDVQRGWRSCMNADDAAAALSDLARHGFGKLVDVPTTSVGGRPTTQFRLSPLVDSRHNPVEHEGNEGSVDWESHELAGVTVADVVFDDDS